MSDDDFDVADCESDHVDSGSDAPAVKTRRRRRRNPVVSAAVSLSCVFLAIGDKPSECNEGMEMFAKMPNQNPNFDGVLGIIGVVFVLWHFKKKNESTDNKITASWQLELLKRHSRAAVVGFTQYEPSHIYGLDGGPFVLSTGDLENRNVLTIQWYTD